MCMCLEIQSVFLYGKQMIRIMKGPIVAKKGLRLAKLVCLSSKYYMEEI